jgi:hypothetical protein
MQILYPNRPVQALEEIQNIDWEKASIKEKREQQRGKRRDTYQPEPE